MIASSETTNLYSELAREFEHTFHDNRGGIDLTYITGEQATSRLNEVLGYDGWSFRILESKVIEDEVLVLGELTVKNQDRSNDPEGVVRQQYGSQKIKRRKDGGAILDVGFDFKGAATDSLKKCASLIGVGLYLSRKEEQSTAGGRVTRDQPSTKGASAGLSGPPPRQWDADGNVVAGAGITCETCGEGMYDTTRNDGSIWTAEEKAAYSRKRYQGRILCYNCSRNAG